MEKQYNKITGIIHSSLLKQRLDQALAQLLIKYSRSRIKHWILNGMVKVNGQIITIPKKKMMGGEFIQIEGPELLTKAPICEAKNIRLNILYEDEDIIIINKPCNIVVHPGAGKEQNTIIHALLYHYPSICAVPRFGIIHRLDKDTTGVMIVAKTMLAHIKLVAAMKNRIIIREYEAIVVGNLSYAVGTIDKCISRHPVKRIHMTVHPKGKMAITHYVSIEQFRYHTRLRLRLETGRTHQIRVHMAHINHPIVGDQTYGSRILEESLPHDMSETCKKTILNFKRQALHAVILKLNHPITAIPIQCKAPLPMDMMNLIHILKFDASCCIE